MNFILVLTTILFGGFAVWLWRLGKAQMISPSFEKRLISIPDVTVTSLKYNNTIVFSKKVPEESTAIRNALIVKILIAALKDENLYVHLGAAEALRKIGEPAVEPLIAALKDEDSDVRFGAAGALGEIGDSRAVEPLIAALKDENLYVRFGAADALGKIGEPAVEPLIDVLNDEDLNVALKKSIARSFEDEFTFLNAGEPLIAPGYLELPERYRTIEYDGHGKLPKKVYQGDLHTITIDLEFTSWISSESTEPFIIRDTNSGKSIILRIQQDTSIEQFVEIQLLAAGVTVIGEDKQRRKTTSNKLSYHWSCLFDKSGKHEVSLITRLVNPHETTKRIAFYPSSR